MTMPEYRCVEGFKYQLGNLEIHDANCSYRYDEGERVSLLDSTKSALQASTQEVLNVFGVSNLSDIKHLAHAEQYWKLRSELLREASRNSQYWKDQCSEYRLGWYGVGWADRDSYQERLDGIANLIKYYQVLLNPKLNDIWVNSAIKLALSNYADNDAWVDSAIDLAMNNYVDCN